MKIKNLKLCERAKDFFKGCTKLFKTKDDEIVNALSETTGVETPDEAAIEAGISEVVMEIQEEANAKNGENTELAEETTETTGVETPDEAAIEAEISEVVMEIQEEANAKNGENTELAEETTENTTEVNELGEETVFEAIGELKVAELNKKPKGKVKKHNKKWWITSGSIVLATAALVVVLHQCSNQNDKPDPNVPTAGTTVDGDTTPNDPTTEGGNTIPGDTTNGDIDNEVLIQPVVLTKENIDEEVSNIIKENESKGFYIDEEKVKSALFISNVNNLDAEDIYEIFGYQFDGVENENTRLMLIAEQIQNLYDYVSAVRTHNNNGNEYVSMANLVSDLEDRKIILALEEKYLELVDGLTNNTITEEEFQASFKYVTEFFTGAGYVDYKDEKYSNYSLTAGGGLVSEAYWPMFAVAYSSSELLTDENKTDIKTLSEGSKNQPAVVNGSKYLSSIISVVDSCTNEITKEEGKQLTR